MKKILQVGAIITISIIAVLLMLFYFIFGGACQNQVFKEYNSPDQSLKAVVFQRDCGATTGFSTQISILESDENLDNESGNIFIVKGHPAEIAPEIVWNGNEDIVIHHHIDGKEFKAENQFGWINTVKITYE